MVEDGDFMDVIDMSAREKPVCEKFIVPQYEIVQYFSEVKTKNEVVDGFLRFGGCCFANLAVFSVFSNSIQFLKGAGDNVRGSECLGSVPVDKNTVIRRVIVNKFPYRGPIPVGEDEKRVIDKFFNRYAEEVFVYPGSIRGEETDILFYADGFEGERESSIVSFEYIIEKTILALKLLWVQKELTTI